MQTTRLLLLTLLAAMALGSVGCNDAARCTNACQNQYDCDPDFLLGRSVDGCSDLCVAALEALGEDNACREAASNVISCLQFASCSSLEDGTACQADRDERDEICDEDMNTMGM